VQDLEPDLRGLARLFVKYRTLNRLEDAKFIAGRYAPQLEEEARRLKGTDAARPWFAASNVYLFLEDQERALTCIEQAVRASPGDANFRRAYAFRLLEAGRYDEAIAQFQWRLRRDPKDESSRAGLARAMRRGVGEPPVAQNPAAGRKR
jgi:tetratricopeptide (TPR) repeat protein